MPFVFSSTWTGGDPASLTCHPLAGKLITLSLNSVFYTLLTDNNICCVIVVAEDVSDCEMEVRDVGQGVPPLLCYSPGTVSRHFVLRNLSIFSNQPPFCLRSRSIFSNCTYAQIFEISHNFVWGTDPFCQIVRMRRFKNGLSSMFLNGPTLKLLRTCPFCLRLRNSQLFFRTSRHFF